MIRRIKDWFIIPSVSIFLTILAGLSFFLLCMMLPLVGPAGSLVEHAELNKVIFTRWISITLFLSVLAFSSKFSIYKINGGPLPVVSSILILVSILIFIIFLFGGLSI